MTDLDSIHFHNLSPSCLTHDLVCQKTITKEVSSRAGFPVINSAPWPDVLMEVWCLLNHEAGVLPTKKTNLYRTCESLNHTPNDYMLNQVLAILGQPPNIALQMNCQQDYSLC